MNKQNLTLEIRGMSCASCVNRIEKALKKNSSIIDAVVNLATEKASIQFDADKTDSKQIVDIIKKIGYEVIPIDRKLRGSLNDELKIEFKNLLVCSLLSLPLVLPMILKTLGINFHIHPLLQLALATPVQFIFGAKFYRSAWSALKSQTGNMELLVALGTSSAFGLSFYHLLKNLNHLNDIAHNLYFESSSVIITFISLGKFFEKRATRQTTSAINALQRLRPEMARIKTDGVEREITLSEVKVQDIVVIRPGERVAVDGKILKGVTEIDESLITGESLPVPKSVNSNVIGGSINGDGAIEVIVTAIGKETLLSKIIKMVEDAQAVKAPIQKLVDKVSAIFVPVVIFLAFLTFGFSTYFSGDWEASLIRSIAVLVIACPCALGLATPTSIMVGTGVAAREGILIKDALALESTHHITTVAFDKTGTLTQGRPVMKSLTPFLGDENDLLKLIASLQKRSEHPLARAVLVEASNRNINLSELENSRALPGKGIEGEIHNIKYILGAKSVVSEYNLSEKVNWDEVKDKEAKGETVSFLIDTTHNQLIGMVTFKDHIRSESKGVIQGLKDLGIKTVILTGDTFGSAKNIANELGVDSFFAETLPMNKMQIINRLRDENEIVAMVGDGINDAPALASASVGIALSSGTDVAMHSAGITLMSSNPLLILDAIDVSKKTYQKIKQNLFWAFIYNIIGIPLAALGHLNPMIAGGAMALSSLSVVTNSLLLKRWKSQRTSFS